MVRDAHYSSLKRPLPKIAWSYTLVLRTIAWKRLCVEYSWIWKLRKWTQIAQKLLEVQEEDDYSIRQENFSGIDLNWRTFNRIRTGIARVKTNIVRWNQIEQQDTLCNWEEIQNIGHLRTCRNCPKTCSLNELWNAEQNAVDVCQYWTHRL